MKADITPIPDAEIRNACKQILGSAPFRKSPRLQQLLTYLVEKAISKAARDTSEFAIGIEVFGRNPSNYHTGEDPIVRVQAGRLRTKLETFYAHHDPGLNIEITIPKGGYMPVIRRTGAVHDDAARLPMLAIQPFKCTPQRKDEELFMHGLYEELVHQLHLTLKNITVLTLPALQSPGSVASLHPPHRQATYLLEGSIQIDGGYISTSARMFALASSCLVWAKKFHRDAQPSIALQEEIAISICCSLKQFIQK